MQKPSEKQKASTSWSKVDLKAVAALGDTKREVPISQEVRHWATIQANNAIF